MIHNSCGYILSPRRRRPARVDTALGILAWLALTVLAVLGHAWACFIH